MSGMSVIMVDADHGAAGIIQQALEKHDISVSCHSNGRDSLRELQSGRHHWAMLIELSLPDMDGIELLREARRILPHLPCLILSERDQAEPAVHAMKAGAEDYFTKPIDIPRLLNALRGAIAMVPGAQEGEQVKYLSAVEGRWKSAAMKNAHDLALRAAITDRPVALTGPANSGRNAMARFIHAHSKSAADPFHSLDLAARTSRQVEIELFGVDLLECEHAMRQTKGRLNRPGKGTLHLDHIEMLRPCAQQALWQRLVGSKAPQPGSPALRLIVTTSADMRALIARGGFPQRLVVCPLGASYRSPRTCAARQGLAAAVRGHHHIDLREPAPPQAQADPQGTRSHHRAHLARQPGRVAKRAGTCRDHHRRWSHQPIQPATPGQSTHPTRSGHACHHGGFKHR